MKDFIYNEMMTHVALCSHKEPKNVLIVSDDADGLVDEIKKHHDIKQKTIGCALDDITKEDSKIYDVVLCEADVDEFFASHVDRVLKEDGLVVMKHPSLDEVDKNTTLMQNLGKYFKIIMPFNLYNGDTLLLASKEYHPTADIILQRADLLDGLRYYNCDVHVGSFAMGNFIRKQYLGIIKN